MRAGIVWLKVERLSVMSQSRVSLAFFQQQIAEIGVGIGKFRLELEGALIIFDRLVGLATLSKGSPQTIITFGMVRIGGQGRFQMRNRGSDVTFLDQGRAEIVLPKLIIWFVFQGLLEMRDRFVGRSLPE